MLECNCVFWSRTVLLMFWKITLIFLPTVRWFISPTTESWARQLWEKLDSTTNLWDIGVPLHSKSTSMITICSPISLNNHQRCCCRFQIQKGSRNCSRKVRIHVWKQRVIYWKKVPYKGEKASCSFWQITKPDLIMMMIKWWLTLITATNLQHFHSQRQ